MAEPKTKPTDVPVADFIESIADERVRDDCRTIAGIMQAAIKTEAADVGGEYCRFRTVSVFQFEWQDDGVADDCFLASQSRV